MPGALCAMKRKKCYNVHKMEINGLTKTYLGLIVATFPA